MTKLGSPPTVIYMSRRYPPSVGGMQRLSRELHRALAVRLPVRAVAWGGAQSLLPLFLPLAVARVASWLARPRATGSEVLLAGDAVLAPLALGLGRAFDRPVAAVVHGLDAVYPNRLHQALVPPALRRIDLAIAISEHVRSLVVGLGVAPDRCLAIPCGVDATPSPPRAAARARIASRLGTQLDGRPVLLTVGRLVPRKGVAWFVRDVLPRLSSLEPAPLYLVAGEGPERDAIASAGELLPGVVRLLGSVDDDLRADLYAAADLFVMPNRALVGDPEGFGLVAVEAALAGLPVVATAVDGVREAVVDGEAGWLVRPDAPDALAQTIERVLTDGLAARLAPRAAAVAEARFSWTSIGDRYAEALACLARSRRSGAR